MHSPAFNALKAFPESKRYPDDDPEEIIRLGEGRYASILLSLAKVVVYNFRILEGALSEAQKIRSYDVVEKPRRQILKSIVNLAE